jgi:hypothetical protein
MKYALAYKTDNGNWIFMGRCPSKESPWGWWGSGMWKFDTHHVAENVLFAIRDVPTDCHDRLEFNAEVRVVEIPDEAMVKFNQARKLTDWCLANPHDGVPVGSRENSLFHRGKEIGEMGREGHRILLEHINKQFG